MLKMRRKFKEWVVDGGVDGGDGGVERMVDGGSLTSWVKTGHGVHYRDLARETKECYQDQDQGSLPSKTPLLFFKLFPFSLPTMGDAKTVLAVVGNKNPQDAQLLC